MPRDDSDNSAVPGDDDETQSTRTDGDKGSPTLPVSALERVDQTCKDFEAAWKRGDRPRIEDHLGDSSGQQRAQLLHELILLDVEYRFQQGETPSRDEYRERFSEYVEVVDAISYERPEGFPPDQIGPYKILGVLGKGGMGIVYLAEQREPIRRRVALKCMTRTDHREFLARFESERQALALMDHPNIARVYDVGATEDGKPFYTMEHVQGVPITDYCDQHKLSIGDRLKLFLQVCQGVEHAHRKDVIHRDLKPSNVLVSTRDGKPLAKIIDFGVAKATNQRLTERTLYTEVGRVIGTPQYMSPEQAKTTGEDVDHRIDIYSLGVLLYELLIAQLPLELDVRVVALEEVLRRVREEEPPTPSTRWTNTNVETQQALATRRGTTAAALRHELRGDLDWICMKALEKERDRRYKTADHFADDVEHYLKNEAVEARPPSALYRVRKYVRKHRTPVAALTVVVLSLATGLVVALLFYAVAVKQTELADQRADENLVLADLKRLEGYQAEANDLWPTSAKKIDVITEWLAKAEEFAGRLAKHERDLAKLRQSALPEEQSTGDGQPTDERVWRFGDKASQDRHEMLALLVEGLRKFDDPAPETGTLAAVKRRLELGPTKGEYTQAWQAATASASNDPKYKGLKIRVQEGLYPIGRDPESQLWEFVHLRTGRVPERDPATRKLVLTKETGLVLVLLPGGKFLMGAETTPSNEKPEGSANVDPRARPDEGPIHEVTLSAFLIGKYEVRQCEWERVTGENPSAFRGESLPVETVSWHEAKAFAEELGLRLPSEAQWEYACRARTTTPYAGTGKLDEMGWYRNNSGLRTHPVGEIKLPNRFGLHDVHGNVWEWCEDVYDEEFYSKPEASTSDPVCTSGSLNRIRRGGGWLYGASYCRASFRWDGPGGSGNVIGLRLAGPAP